MRQVFRKIRMSKAQLARPTFLIVESAHFNWFILFFLAINNLNYQAVVFLACRRGGERDPCPLPRCWHAQTNAETRDTFHRLSACCQFLSARYYRRGKWTPARFVGFMGLCWSWPAERISNRVHWDETPQLDYTTVLSNVTNLVLIM